MLYVSLDPSDLSQQLVREKVHQLVTPFYFPRLYWQQTVDLLWGYVR